jgi:hypothetical protein
MLLRKHGVLSLHHCDNSLSALHNQRLRADIRFSS